MRLFKLAALALFGYALYEFFRGMLQDTRLGNMASEAFGQMTQGQGGGGQSSDGGGQSRGMNISGPGEGIAESTLENDGGSVSHKVGRGVIS